MRIKIIFTALLMAFTSVCAEPLPLHQRRPKINTTNIIKGLNAHSTTLAELGITNTKQVDAEHLILAIFRELSVTRESNIRVEFEIHPTRKRHMIRPFQGQKKLSLRKHLDLVIDQTRWKYRIIDGGVLVWQFNFVPE